MTPVKAILFDKDGTLFDFASTWEAWAHAFLMRVSGDVDQAVQIGHAIGFDVHKRKFAEDSLVIAGTPDDVARALSAHLPDHTTAALIDILNEEAAIAPQVEAVPLHPFLSQLRSRGLRLGVATNDAEEPARAHLASAGVTDLFDFIAGYDSGFGGKPAPGQLLAFAQSVDLAPAHVLMVGDSLHDLFAAKAAGMPAVGVLTGMAETAELAPHAETVLPDIGALEDWLNKRNTPHV